MLQLLQGYCKAFDERTGHVAVPAGIGVSDTDNAHREDSAVGAGTVGRQPIDRALESPYLFTLTGQQFSDETEPEQSDTGYHEDQY
jgi:hypothetical protein